MGGKMSEENNSQVNQVSRKMQLMNEDIKNELKMNPCIINKEAFIDAIYSNMKRFINENYRD